MTSSAKKPAPQTDQKCQISIGSVNISLPSLPGIDPKILANQITQHLENSDSYDFELSQSVTIDSLRLPPLHAVAGESAASLAKRIVQAVGRSLNTTVNASRDPFERKAL